MTVLQILVIVTYAFVSKAVVDSAVVRHIALNKGHCARSLYEIGQLRSSSALICPVSWLQMLKEMSCIVSEVCER